MVMSRLDIITEAREFGGPKTFKPDLRKGYDWVLKTITSLHPILRNQQKTGVLVVDQNYLVLPPNFAFPELFKVDENELDWVEPESWRADYDEDDTSGSPSIWTVQKANRKLFMHVPPSTAWDYILYYACTHPKAGRTLSFTSGGTTEIKPGVTITGGTSSATGVVAFVSLDSGTWAAGSAAGSFILSSQTGTFSSENLNVGAATNLATIAANSTNEDSFEHLLGEEFDETIVYGVAKFACLKSNPPLAEKATLYDGLFNSSLELHTSYYDRRSLRVSYINF